MSDIYYQSKNSSTCIFLIGTLIILTRLHSSSFSILRHINLFMTKRLIDSNVNKVLEKDTLQKKGSNLVNFTMKYYFALQMILISIFVDTTPQYGLVLLILQKDFCHFISVQNAVNKQHTLVHQTKLNCVFALSANERHQKSAPYP